MGSRDPRTHTPTTTTKIVNCSERETTPPQKEYINKKKVAFDETRSHVVRATSKSSNPGAIPAFC